MDTKPIEILLVEDSDDDIVILQEAFAESKLVHLVNVVRDGAEALAHLRREGKYKDARMPGLILLDINMPKKGGFEVLREIKADPALRHFLVIMLTVSDRDEDIVKSYATGACSYIRKPVDFDSLRKVINHFEIYWTLVADLPTPKG